MTPDPYRSAYERALAEITEIAAKFERLQARKTHVEHLVVALQGILAPDASRSEAISAVPDPLREDNTAAPVETAQEAGAQSDYSYLEVPTPLPDGDGDPFQRRVRTSFRFRGLSTQRSY
jgi:hypothetical protein